jgi:signal transduction histidine kinase
LLRAFDSIGAGVLLLDASGVVALANAPMRELLPALTDLLRPGVRVADIRAALAGEDPAAALDALVAPAAAGLVRQEPMLADGRRLAVESRPTADGGKLLLWRDAAAGGREAVLSDADRLEELSRQLPGVIYRRVVTPSGEVTFPFVGEGIGDLMGVAASAIRREPSLFEAAIHPDDRVQRRRSLARSAETMSGCSCEFRVLPADSSVRWLRSSAEPSRLEDGSILWDGFLIDISEQKLAEGELLRSKELAELAVRSRVDFLANISHEFRTPLNAIIGFAEVIQNELFGTVDSERYKGYVNDIRESGKHLLELVSDLLDISRLEAGRLELSESYVDVNRMVDSCIRMVRDRANISGVAVAADLPKRSPSLLADERKVKQILLNLLANAIKFTPEGGRIDVSLEWPGDGEMAIVVRDTGIGIAEADLATALEPFGQIDSGLGRKHDGAGLGLPLSKSLIELHDGRLDLESEVDVGTSIRAVFPKSRVGALEREPS